MPKQLPDHFPRTISQYVPSMEMAADVINGRWSGSLGAPAAADADGILNDKSATGSAQTYTSSDFETTFDGGSSSLTSTVGMLDATFGRCLTMVGTAGSNHVVTVTGRDYLGQIMSEAITLSGTSTIYGEKAFKYVDTIAAASGASGDTFDVGWDDRLGLPYAARRILEWYEDDVAIAVGEGQIPVVAIDCVSADTVFGVNNNAGFVTRMDTVVNIATQSGATALTVEVGGTAVAGLSVTIAASAAIGSLDTGSATDDHGATSKIGSNAAIEVVSDGGTATTGTADALISVTQGVFFIDADGTTATTTTGDPRGTVQPHTACNGSVEFEVVAQINDAQMHGVAQA